MNAIVVYGATGHTGRFVVEELRRQNLPVIASGRNATDLAAQWPDLDVRPAHVDDADALDKTLAGAAAVINAAGPFAATAAPLIAAAERARIPYVDVAAEIETNQATLARRSTVPVAPAMAFYGGLADLLVTAALGERMVADQIQVAYGLSSWHPTPGTRITGQVWHERRGGRRVRFADGRLQYHDDQLVQEDWLFPDPLGRRRVLSEFSMADVVTIPSHLAVREVRTYMSVEAASDLAKPDTPPPVAVDELGRSDQVFAVDVRIDGGLRASVTGQDIYAISAPLAVGAVRRILAGEARTPAGSAGALFEPVGFLKELPLTLDLP